MLKTVLDKKKNNIYLETVGDKEWRFNYKKSIYPIIKDFDNACENMEIGEYEKAENTFRKIINQEPMFVDAYCHLALIIGWSGKSDETVKVLENGIENILTLIPDDFFDKPNRLEWGWLENRPFLRTYANLGLLYFDNNLFEKAEVIFKRILTINPNDNQGMRDPLLNCYLKLEKLDVALELCNQYREDILVGMTYGRALVLYKLGMKKEAENQFLSAMQYSPKVAEELIKPKHIKPKNYGMGLGVAIGSQEEAYEYWQYYGKTWKSTPGTLIFIKNCLAKAQKIRSLKTVKAL